MRARRNVVRGRCLANPRTSIGQGRFLLRIPPNSTGHWLQVSLHTGNVSYTGCIRRTHTPALRTTFELTAIPTPAKRSAQAVLPTTQGKPDLARAPQERPQRQGMDQVHAFELFRTAVAAATQGRHIASMISLSFTPSWHSPDSKHGGSAIGSVLWLHYADSAGKTSRSQDTNWDKHPQVRTSHANACRTPDQRKVGAHVDALCQVLGRTGRNDTVRHIDRGALLVLRQGFKSFRAAREEHQKAHEHVALTTFGQILAASVSLASGRTNGDVRVSARTRSASRAAKRRAIDASSDQPRTAHSASSSRSRPK